MVYRAVRKSTGEFVAVKCFSRKDLTQHDEASIRAESNMLMMLDHPHITKCIEVFEEPNCFYIVTELVAGGELFSRIVQKSYYSEKDARDLVEILISAIKYCHDHDVVHR